MHVRYRNIRERDREKNPVPKMQDAHVCESTRKIILGSVSTGEEVSVGKYNLENISPRPKDQFLLGRAASLSSPFSPFSLSDLDFPAKQITARHSHESMTMQ